MNYFATSFSSVGNLFRGLDRWIRMRIRAMKFKRKSRADNWRFRRKHFRNLEPTRDAAVDAVDDERDA